MDFFIFLPILAGVVILAAVIGGGIYLLNQIRGRSRPGSQETPDTGIGTLRRLYFYAVSFVGLIMAANGVVQIIRFVVEEIAETQVVSDDSLVLAVGVSLVVVGLPIWAFHWRSVARHVRELPVEHRSLVRKVYIYLVLGVSVGFFLSSGIRDLEWAFRTQELSPYSIASLLVWSTVWLYHWRIEGADGQPTEGTRTVRRLYLYLTSLATLSMASIGGGLLVLAILVEAYEVLTSTPVLAPSDNWPLPPEFRDGLALTLVSVSVWAVHWLLFASGDIRSLMRRLYIHLFPMFGGLVMIVTGLGVAIYAVLEWSMGAQGSNTAADHFRIMPAAVATVSVGLGLWWYHSMVSENEKEFDIHRVSRAYGYLLVSAGLAVTALTVVTLTNLLLGLAVESGPGLVTGTISRGRQLAVVVTLGLLGAPAVVANWRGLQRYTAMGGLEDRASLVRRVFLMAVLGAGLLAAVGALSTLVFFALRDLFEDGLSRATLTDGKTAIGILLAAALGLPYFWSVYRDDRAILDEAEPAAVSLVRKSVTVLTGSDGHSFVARLEDALGYQVHTVRWVDADARSPDSEATDFEGVARRVSDSPGTNVFMFPHGAQLRLLSYD